MLSKTIKAMHGTPRKQSSTVHTVKKRHSLGGLNPLIVCRLDSPVTSGV